MAYKFESIKNISITDTISENLNLLAEQDGKTVRLNSAVIPKLNDTKVSEKETWSSKKIINSLCPTLEEKEPIVKCLPLAKSPLEVSSYIESKQEGTGTPSPDNICPISGWNDTIRLVKHGKNLIPFPYVEGGEGTIKQSNGITFTVLPDRGIKVEGTAETGAYLVLQRKCDYGEAVMDAMSNPKGHSNGKYAVSHRLYYNSTNKTLSLNIAKGTTVNEVVYPQIEVGTVSTTYEPYQEDTYSIDLNETIYGGSYNWTTGTLTKTYEIITLTGNEPFTKNGDKPQYFFYHDKSRGALINPICSHFKGDYKGAYDNNIANTVAVRKTLFWIYTPQFNTVSDLKVYLTEQYNAGTPVTIVYQMEEPISIPQFEPINIEAIDGENFLYSNCGETKVKYDEDIKKYVDKAIEEATKEDEYELIETITVNEEIISIIREGLALKEVIVTQITKPNGTGNKGAFMAAKSAKTGTEIVTGGSYITKDYEYSSQYGVYKNKNLWFGYSCGKEKGWGGGNNLGLNNAHILIKADNDDYIDRVRMYVTNEGTYTIGTKIEIWGVRADA